LGPHFPRWVGGEQISVAKRLNNLISVIDQRGPDCPLEGSDNELLWDFLVETAVGFLPSTEPEYPELQQPLTLPPKAAAFLRALERDTFTVSGGILRRTLPIDIGLPATQSEVDRLLVKHGFAVPKGQLEQAIDAHPRGNWAGANGQFRPFLEGLLDGITARLVPSESKPLRGLAAIGFLRRDLHERDFMDGLIKRLHPEGPHPGLSGNEDSTFRFHMVLLTARLLLTRFDTGGLHEPARSG
jgi:hypothetical protein